MPSEDEFTEEQIGSFDRISFSISEQLPYRPLRHIANSAGIERFPGAQFDMCRLGIGLYGIDTAGEGSLKPVSRLITRIVQVKDIAPGETVGYGRAGRAEGAVKIATVPVGYADGLRRDLGEGRWSVLVKGRPAPIMGRVCMDSCMIDVTGLDVAEGDEVTVFGDRPGNTVGDMARILGTIPYEIMTSIPERVKRIYVKE
jgi:alanine racemase